MNESTTSLPPPLPPDLTPPQGLAPWRRLVAWVVIGLSVALTMISVAWDKAELADEDPAEAGPDAQAELYGRFALGQRALLGKVDLRDVPFSEEGEVWEVLSLAVLQGEVEGGEKALAVLQTLRAKREGELNDTQRQLLAQLEAIYRGKMVRPDETAAELAEDAGPTGEDAIDLLRERLGWYGKVAEVYGRSDSHSLRREVMDESLRTFVAYVLGGLAVVVVLLFGAVLCCLAVVLFVKGVFRWKLAAERPLLSTGGSLWVEAFALYLGIMVLGGLMGEGAMEMCRRLTGGALPGRTAELVLTALPMLIGVGVGLWWPRRWGAWGELYRRAWGWHRGRGVGREVAAGVLGYVAGLPIVVVGVVITLGLVALSGADASHPLNEMAQAPGYVVVLLSLMAVVWAPLTEELFFRGALYVGLREHFGYWASGLLSGCLFAAVHPQGWAAIPALTSIGLVLALLREWRGSLIAPITAHALNNGSLVLMLLLLHR